MTKQTWEKPQATPDILSAQPMRQQYGDFYDRSPMVRLDRSKVPEQFWPLLPYAEFRGNADNWTREGLIKQAPRGVQQNFKQVVAAFDSALGEWLAGPEADDRNPSDEYVAFVAMTMAADYL